VSKMKRIAGTVLLLIICVGSLSVCFANDNKEASNRAALLFVVDNSKESYGVELKNEVYAQLAKNLKISVTKESELLYMSNGFGEMAKAERSELLELADKSDAKLVLVVEILPIKSDFREILFYRAIKSEATLKVRVYDVVKRQYSLIEEAAGTGNNKTMIPYTFVGKKPTVLEAVHKAAVLAAERINQTVDVEL